MPGNTLNIAAVGTGGIWNAHAKNLSVIGGNKIVAVCDVNDDNRKKHAEANNARGYADIRQMLAAEKEIDAIVACTPPTVRLQIVEAAAERGIPVFLEKPPAFSLDDARKIVAVVEKTRLPVVVGFMYRYLAAVDRLKQLIGSEPINLVQSSFYCPGATIWKLPAWFYIKEKSGGHVLDQAVHVMDLIRYVAGDITSVYTLGNNVICPKSPTFTMEDSSSTTMRFASGASGTHVHTWAHNKFTGFLTVFGKEFKLTIELDLKLTGYVGDKVIDETFAPPPQGCSHHYEEMRVFLDAVRTKNYGTLRSPFPDAAKSLATVLAMNQSIDRGLPVAVAL